MAVVGLSTAFSPLGGSWVAVRIRQGCKPAGVSLSPRRRRRTSRAAAAAAVRAEDTYIVYTVYIEEGPPPLGGPGRPHSSTPLRAGPDEAKRLVAEEGYTVLDIRDRTQRERAYIKSSTHVPLFIENQDNDIGTIVKRQLHNNFAGLFFGLPFTKLNQDFAKTVKDKFSPENKLLIVCQEGLRSAAAADALEREGYQNIACITSGLQTVKPGTFETVGKSELQNAGKAGLVTIQGKISVVLGTVLISAYLFITFFPDQAEKLFDLAGISL